MSEQEREAKSIKNKRILAWVIGIIMIFSSASYAFMSFDGNSSKSEKISISGIEFKKTDYGSWKFTINEQEFETVYNPLQVLNISVSLSKNIQSYSGKALYFGINSAEEAVISGNSEIINVLGRYVLNYQFSCLSESCSEDYPVKNCSENNVIVFKEAGNSRIYESKGCILIEFFEGDETRVADAFVFSVLGFQKD